MIFRVQGDGYTCHRPSREEQQRQQCISVPGLETEPSIREKPFQENLALLAVPGKLTARHHLAQEYTAERRGVAHRGTRGQ